jgi:hypothetical protein
MSKKKLSVFLLAAFLICVTTGRAVADNSPSAQLNFRINNPYTIKSVTSSTTSLLDSLNGPFDASSGFVNGGYTPSVGISVSTEGGHTSSGFASAVAQYTYYFKVSGGALPPTVPIDVDYSMSYLMTGNAYWQGNALLLIGGLDRRLSVGYDPGSNTTTVGSHVETISVPIDTWIKAYISAEGNVYASYFDPTKTISLSMLLDPSINFASGYSGHIDFITAAPPAPVPIPASMALFGPGLVGLVAFRRRFKK